jgi:hypothetical protein
MLRDLESEAPNKMRTAKAILAALAIAAGPLAPVSDALGQQQAREQQQIQQRTQERAGKREIIPGSELMTGKEREDYRRRYAAAQTDAEREKVRSDHIRAMEERARLRGLKLAVPVQPQGQGK